MHTDKYHWIHWLDEFTSLEPFVVLQTVWFVCMWNWQNRLFILICGRWGLKNTFHLLQATVDTNICLQNFIDSVWCIELIALTAYSREWWLRKQNTISHTNCTRTTGRTIIIGAVASVCRNFFVTATDFNAVSWEFTYPYPHTDRSFQCHALIVKQFTLSQVQAYYPLWRQLRS